MKKTLTLAAIALIGLSAITSCKKSSSSPSYNMKATIGSTSFNENNCTATASGGNLLITGYVLSGNTAVPPQINIAIITWNGSTGTTTFNSSLSTGYEEYLPNTSTVSESSTGTVTITSVSSTTIVSTFSFTTTDGTLVTNGSFTAQRT